MQLATIAETSQQTRSHDVCVLPSTVEHLDEFEVRLLVQVRPQEELEWFHLAQLSVKHVALSKRRPEDPQRASERRSPLRQIWQEGCFKTVCATKCHSDRDGASVSEQFAGDRFKSAPKPSAQWGTLCAHEEVHSCSR